MQLFYLFLVQVRDKRVIVVVVHFLHHVIVARL